MKKLEKMLEMLDSDKTQEFIVKEITEKVAKQNPTEDIKE